MTSPRNQFVFSGRNTARVSILVIMITVLLVWGLGFQTHRSLLENALLSTTIISAALFVFLFAGLYRGLALHDDIGWSGDGRGSWLDGVEIPADMEGEGCLIALVLWLVVGLLVLLLQLLLPAGLEPGLIGMLYWGFFRALNTVFSRSAECKGNWRNSLGYALLFTVLYCGWVYGVIYLADWL